MPSVHRPFRHRQPQTLAQPVNRPQRQTALVVHEPRQLPLRDARLHADPVATAFVLVDRLSQLLAERLLFACHGRDSICYLSIAQVVPAYCHQSTIPELAGQLGKMAISLGAVGETPRFLQG
jgi:hypothetical protein